MNAQGRTCKILVHQVSMIGSQIEYWTWSEEGKKKVEGCHFDGSNVISKRCGKRYARSRIVHDT